MAPTAIQALVELEATRRKVEEYFSSNKSKLEAYSGKNSKTHLGDESLQKKKMDGVSSDSKKTDATICFKTCCPEGLKSI